MLLWLYRFFIVGFPPKCVHEFGEWEITKAFSNKAWGDVIVHQGRRCSKCGLHEFRVDRKG
jgi:hypothetical protein